MIPDQSAWVGNLTPECRGRGVVQVACPLHAFEDVFDESWAASMRGTFEDLVQVAHWRVAQCLDLGLAVVQEHMGEFAPPSRVEVGRAAHRNGLDVSWCDSRGAHPLSIVVG